MSQQIIGLLTRVSTARQLGNARSEAQVDMGLYLQRQGYAVRGYDEGAVSGRQLALRAVALRMLDDLDRGEIHGIAAYDVKRLTRDEFGIDGGSIAKRLIDAGGLLVTFGKTYDLRDEDDLLHFQFQCMLAGIDVRSIRNTFWQGIFKRLEHSPMFTRPPLGYMTEYLPGERPGVLIKIPRKHPDHAELMDHLCEYFEACRSLGEVVRRLSDAGFVRPPVTYRGEVTSTWTVQTLRYMLTQNKIYEGLFELGGPKRKNGKPRSVVWHKFARDETGRYRVFRHEVPELAYWSPAQARRWRAKFATKQDRPAVRARVHTHALLGTLVCVNCGAPMIGAGRSGYVCRNHRTSGCRQPQKLAEHIVMALLRTLLADALADVSDLAARIEDDMASPAPSASVLKLAHLEERSERLAADYARMDRTNEAMLKELSRLQEQIDAARVVVAAEAEERQANIELRAALDLLRSEPVEAFESLSAEQQAHVYALLFRNVRIGYQGRAGARRWWLVSYESAFAAGRIDVLQSATVRVLPWAVSGRVGLPSLCVESRTQIGRSAALSTDSDRAISAYLSSLLGLSSALRSA